MDEKCRGCELLIEDVARLDERIKAIVGAQGLWWDRIDERFRGSDKVRDDRAVILEKALTARLDVLNHWHEISVEKERAYITILLYNEQHSQLVRRIDTLENWKSWALGGLAMLGVLTALVLAMLSLYNKTH